MVVEFPIQRSVDDARLWLAELGYQPVHEPGNSRFMVQTIYGERHVSEHYAQRYSLTQLCYFVGNPPPRG